MAKGGRQNKIQKNLKYSVRTGTNPRQKKKNFSAKDLHMHRLVRKTLFDSKRTKRLDIEFSIYFNHNLTKELILDSSNDEVILNLNEKRLKKQRKVVKELALVLNRLNISSDVSEMITSMSLNNIYIERNIFKVLPKDMIEIFYKKGTDEIIKENEINSLMKKYMKNNHIYDFLEGMLMDEL